MECERRLSELWHGSPWLSSGSSQRKSTDDYRFVQDHRRAMEQLGEPERPGVVFDSREEGYFIIP